MLNSPVGVAVAAISVNVGHLKKYVDHSWDAVRLALSALTTVIAVGKRFCALAQKGGSNVVPCCIQCSVV